MAERTKKTTAASVVQDMLEKHILPTVKSRGEYGGSFLQRRIIYFTDRIASKTMRIRNHEDRMMHGIAPLSEGIAAELRDIIVYGLFALHAIDQLGEFPAKDGECSPDEVRGWAYRYFGIPEPKE